jgi:phosphohistidine phosphatase
VTIAKLYLIRHGIAADRLDGQKDEERALTEEGASKTKQVAKKLRDLDIRFDLILTSPLVRARQTAEILQSAGLSGKIEESSDLAPDGEISSWLETLERWCDGGGSSLALVGHQPDLGNWAEILVWGEARQGLVLKKAGIIGLLLPDTGTAAGRCSMFWLSSPKLLAV